MTINRVPQHRYGSHVSQAVSDEVVPLAPDALARGVLLQAIGANVRFTLDGTDPEGGAVGFLLYDTHAPTLVDLGSNITVKMIRDGDDDAVVALQYLGELS